MAGVVAVTDGAKTSLMKRMKEREVRRVSVRSLSAVYPPCFRMHTPSHTAGCRIPRGLLHEAGCSSTYSVHTLIDTLPAVIRVLRRPSCRRLG